jgi:hypothetical protein
MHFHSGNCSDMLRTWTVLYIIAVKMFVCCSCFDSQHFPKSSLSLKSHSCTHPLNTKCIPVIFK